MKSSIGSLFGRKNKSIMNLCWKTENEELIYTTNHPEANAGVFYSRILTTSYIHISI